MDFWWGLQEACSVISLLYYKVTSNLSSSQWHRQSKEQATYRTTLNHHKEIMVITACRWNTNWQLRHILRDTLRIYKSASYRIWHNVSRKATWILVRSCKFPPAGMLKWETLNSNNIPQTWAMVTWYSSWEWRHLQQKQFHWSQKCSVFLECFTLKTKALYETSNATHPVIQRHVLRHESSATMMWEPQNSQ